MPHLFALGMVGVIVFPVYYLVWQHLFPQDYENLGLRLTGALLFLILALGKRWPVSLKKFFNLYWYTTFTYALPFFFTFMLLKNDANLLWAISLMAALTLLILVAQNWIVTFSSFLAGTLLAILFYLTSSDLPIPAGFIQQLPVYLFMTLAGSIYNYNTYTVHREKLKGLSMMGAELAHEIRAPLLQIEQQIKAVSLELGEHQQQCTSDFLTSLKIHADKASRATADLNTIIDILLTTHNKQDISRHKFSCVMVSAVTQRALDEFPYKNGEIDRNKISFDCTEDFPFIGSEPLAMHVLFNLIKNALKFTDHQEKIILSCETGETHNCLHIEDHGMGIPARSLPYIFDEFYTSSEPGRGSGIGLAFCKRVMSDFNGYISCTSEQNNFTRFTLHFPVTTKEQARNCLELPTEQPWQTDATPESIPLLDNYTLLIADDEDINRSHLKKLLHKTGIKMLEAENGRELIKTLDETPCDLVITDLHMPVMSGLEATQSIRNSSSLNYYLKIPIIGVTGDPRPEIQKQCLDAGMNKVVHKPVKQRTLLEALQEFLEPSTDDNALYTKPVPVAVTISAPKPTPEPAPEQRSTKLAKLIHDLRSPLQVLITHSEIFGLQTESWRQTNINANVLETFSKAADGLEEKTERVNQAIDHLWQTSANDSTDVTPGTNNIVSLCKDLENSIAEDVLPALKVFAKEQKNTYSEEKIPESSIAELETGLKDSLRMAEKIRTLVENFNYS